MNDTKKLLLHICCAPDATVPLPSLQDSEGYDVTGYFYGNNIHPESEWLKRLDAVNRLSKILDCNVTSTVYDPDSWLSCVSHLRDEPEGGLRCSSCFKIQLTAAADYAAQFGYGYLCTTLTISPHKNPVLINSLGEAICLERGVKWVSKIWRKGDGFKLSVKRSSEWELFRQKYCGCIYSIRSVVNSDNE